MDSAFVIIPDPYHAYFLFLQQVDGDLIASPSLKGTQPNVHIRLCKTYVIHQLIRSSRVLCRYESIH